MAVSIIAGDALTTKLARSTSAPAAAQMSRARSDGKRTPTCSMTWSVASWIRSIASASSTSIRRPRGPIGLSGALIGRPRARR